MQVGRLRGSKNFVGRSQKLIFIKLIIFFRMSALCMYLYNMYILYFLYNFIIIYYGIITLIRCDQSQ